MAKNKIIFGNTVLVDMTTDTATADSILRGRTAHINTGEQVEGTCDFDANTSDGNALMAEILLGRIAYVNGVKITGSMPNNGAISETISSKDGEITISQGYHDGSGSVSLAASERNKLIPSNIKSGVELFGITGDYSGDSVTAQAKDATPRTTAQVILPDSGFDYLSQVSIAAIPYVETANAYGTTVTIG